jgi:hypothetical protein
VHEPRLRKLTKCIFRWVSRRFLSICRNAGEYGTFTIRVLAEQGQRVPEDISVIGYDDTLPAAFVLPLTTVHQNWREGGRLLAGKALDLIHGDQAESEVLPNNLGIRST